MKFVLIGGKSKLGTNNIEKKLVEMTKNKKVLFCPFAATEFEKSNSKFLNLMNGINCDITFMNSFDPILFNSQLTDCDLLYIGGGCCDILVERFINNGLDKVLIKHINDDKIFAGSSAGAMLYTRVAMGDRYMYTDNFHNYNYKMVNCLGILNINICPHYQNEDLIFYNDELKKYDLDAYGIEEDTALIIENDKFYVLKEYKSASVYYFKKEDRIMVPLYEGVVYEKVGGFRS